jgi:hypothetical protein
MCGGVLGSDAFTLGVFEPSISQLAECAKREKKRLLQTGKWQVCSGGESLTLPRSTEGNFDFMAGSAVFLTLAPCFGAS